jgi:cation transport ATPase
VEVADVTWHGEDLRVVPEAIELARDTVGTIRSNLVLAASYNAAGMALAAGGVLHPVVAAVLMTCSSLVVTWRAMGGLQEEQDEDRTVESKLEEVAA